jgi:hypothetical protein
MNELKYEDLVRASNNALEKVFLSTPAPSPEVLVGYEWRGYNMGFLTKLFRLQKFIKGFFLLNGRIEGYNIPVQPNDLTEPWIHQPSPENPKRYAFFVVSPVDPDSRDNLYPLALLLNYGAGPHSSRRGVESLIRDYLVQPHLENPHLLLGKAYFAFGSRRVFSNFFVIERLRPTNWLPTDS